MSWLSEALRGGKNPADAAMPYLNQIPPMAKQYFEPYIGYGKDAYGTMINPLNQMASDPAAFLESLMSQYEPSRAYQLRRDEALKAAGNTAAAGGVRGNINDIENEARIADSLLGEDMQTWLQNIFGLQGRGIEGLSHFFDTGYDASKSLEGELSNALGTQGQLAFQGQANQNQSKADMFRGLLKALSTGGGAIAGGLSGGPAGALKGAQVGSRFF